MVRSVIKAIDAHLPVNFRFSGYDASAALAWGGTGFLGALFLVQPFDYMKDLVTGKAEEEEDAAAPPPAPKEEGDAGDEAEGGDEEKEGAAEDKEEKEAGGKQEEGGESQKGEEQEGEK